MIEIKLTYHDAKKLYEYLQQFQVVNHFVECNEVNCMYNVTEEVISQICDATGLPRISPDEK